MNTVLVTGATSGIGKACVIKFAKENEDVISNIDEIHESTTFIDDIIKKIKKIIKDKF